jgi:hypothetical protein
LDYYIIDFTVSRDIGLSHKIKTCNYPLILKDYCDKANKILSFEINSFDYLKSDSYNKKMDIKKIE